MITTVSEAREQHVLSCRNLSLFSTINGTNGWARILAPPPVAQFIKEINLKAFSGEVYGIIGAPGSGKTTLLEAISCRGSGDVAGSLQLNNNLLTRERFNNLCAFIHPKQYLLPVLTVRSLIYYTASLHLGGLTTALDINRRVNKVMAEFEILQYGRKRPAQLSKSARRRLLVAVEVVKDPILMVLDDILLELDSLSSYHVLSCLSTYAKKNNRIVLLSLKTPRSDLYQLLDRLTILFYGEVFYSGKTKDLPGYFREAGFPCPSNENPAQHYLTLSTIDRETPERFTETQEQAVALVARFKEADQQPTVDEFQVNRQSYGIGSTVALCYLEKPSTARRLFLLVRRNLEVLVCSPGSFLLALGSSPLLCLLSSLFVTDVSSGSRSSAHSTNGLLSMVLFLHSISTIFATNRLYLPLLRLSYKEYWTSVCSQSLQLVALQLLTVPPLLFPSLLSSAIVLRIAATGFLLITLKELFRRLGLFAWNQAAIVGGLLFSAGLISQNLTISTMMFLPDPNRALSMSLTIFVVLFSLSGSLLRSLPALFSTWLIVSASVNPLSYVGHLLSSTVVSQLKMNCTVHTRLGVDPTPPHSFCRWDSGLTAHQERYSNSYQPETSLLYLLLLLSALYLLTFLLHSIRKPVFLIKKFL